MSGALPKGWTQCNVGEVFAMFGGGTPNKGTPAYWGEGIPWLSSGDIKTSQISSASESITVEGLKNSSARLCRRGSVVVVVRSGILKHTLPIGVLETEAAINQDIKCFDSGSVELNAWLALALRASENEILGHNREGTTVQSVKSQTLECFVLPLPPMDEQRRIRLKLEQVIGKVSGCKARLARIPAILKRFRQSVLAAACSGRLTADWREQNPEVEAAASYVLRAHEIQSQLDEQIKSTGKSRGRHVRSAIKLEENVIGLPEKWCVTKIGNFSYCLDYLRVPINKTERDARQGDIPYFGANGQVGWINDFLFDEELVLVVEDETFIGREKPFSYVIRGKSWVNNHAHVLRPLRGSPVEFLNICLSFYDFTPLTSGTTGRRKLNQEALINAPLWIAPLAEQQEIVRRVESLFTLADQLEARYKKGKAYVDKLTQSILAKAFRGELVPQDASDEPAEKLLERIRGKKQTGNRAGQSV